MTARIALDYAFSVSLLLTPLYCDDIHDVTPRVFALAGCDRLVSEPMSRREDDLEGSNGGNGGGNNGCTFKAFQSCNPKDYDGKGGAIVLTRWIEKMENMIDNNGCVENQS
ncbi:hypothetical protein Tco_0141423, partial [Tanacetum coccineum]